MNGYNNLVNELILRGITKSSANSKAVAETVSILADNEEILTNLKNEKRNQEIVEVNRELELEISETRNTLERLRKEVGTIKLELIEKKKEKGKLINAELEDFYETLHNCETPEGRDTIRKLQLYMQICNINTVYDNTAFINGTAAILSNSKLQINGEPKIVKIKEKGDYENWYTDEWQDVLRI